MLVRIENLHSVLTIMHLSMFSPRRGGGGGGADVGHLIKLVLLRVGNLTGKFVPMVGRFECAE